MCSWGTSIDVEVTIPAHLSHHGRRYRRVFGIDACIAGLVEALNLGGLTTIQSCCGHGKGGNGRIDLADGRVVIILTAVP